MIFGGLFLPPREKTPKLLPPFEKFPVNPHVKRFSNKRQGGVYVSKEVTFGDTFTLKRSSICTNINPAASLRSVLSPPNFFYLTRKHFSSSITIHELRGRGSTKLRGRVEYPFLKKKLECKLQ